MKVELRDKLVEIKLVSKNKVPLLTELIDACAGHFNCLEKTPGGKWRMSAMDSTVVGVGDSYEDAAAECLLLLRARNDKIIF